MKRIACLLAAVLLAAALLVGCNAGTPADASGATTPPEALETAEADGCIPIFEGFIPN